MVIYSKLLEAGTFGHPNMSSKDELAGASVLADIVIGKFMYHLPFHRQIQQYREAGITISKSTMGDWYEAAVERLKFLYDLLRKQILQNEYIHVDEILPCFQRVK